MGDGAAKGQVYRGDDGQWYYRLVGGNNEKMSASEGFTTKESAMRGWQDMRNAASDAPPEPEVVE